jgi:hypothetical protein
MGSASESRCLSLSRVAVAVPAGAHDLLCRNINGYMIFANPRSYNRLPTPFDLAWSQQEHSKWNRNTFPIMCVPVVTNQGGSRCVQLLIRQQTLFLSLPRYWNAK